MWRRAPVCPTSRRSSSRGDATAVDGGAVDEAIGQMVAAVSRVRELVIYCPFSMACLPAWLAMRSASLRVLELRMDGWHLDCIALATGLEELRLWGVSLTAASACGRLQWLRVLEIIGTMLRDSAVKEKPVADGSAADLISWMFLFRCSAREKPTVDGSAADLSDIDSGWVFLGESDVVPAKLAATATAAAAGHRCLGFSPLPMILIWVQMVLGGVVYTAVPFYKRVRQVEGHE